MKTNTDSVLSVEDLTMAYREQAVLWDIDLNIPRACRCAFVGPNGAGKSTLLKGALGLLKPLSGRIRWQGEVFEKMKRQIAYVPQQNQVNWDFPITVRDLVLMGRYPHLGWIRRPQREDHLRADAALEQLNLLPLAKRQISELSGGQRQRAFLARALAQDAEIYVLDEPLAGVDVRSEAEIMGHLKAFQQQGKSILVVHHDLSTVRDYFDYAVLLNRSLIAAGPIDEALSASNLELAYGKRLHSGGEALHE